MFKLRLPACSSDTEDGLLRSEGSVFLQNGERSNKNGEFELEMLIVENAMQGGAKR